MNRVQRQRLFWRTTFFALFVLAPVLDLFRLDLGQGHFILFSHPWTLGIHASDPLQSGINIIVRASLPIVLLVGMGFGISWRYGRLYCGWLCPHFSVVETINNLLQMVSDQCALDVSERDFGHRPEVPNTCFRS